MSYLWWVSYVSFGSRGEMRKNTALIPDIKEAFTHGMSRFAPWSQLSRSQEYSSSALVGEIRNGGEKHV